MDSASETGESRRLRFYRGSARDQAFRISRQIIGSAVFLAACLWGVIGWSLWSDYDRAWVQTTTQQNNLVVALASELRMTLDSQARTFALMDHSLGVFSKQNPPDTALRQVGEEQHGLLGDAPEIILANPDGRVIYSTWIGKPVETSMTGVAHFQAHRNGSSNGLLIDTADENNTPRVAVSRALHTAAGGFAGEATLLLPIGSLLTLDQEFDLGPGSVVLISTPKGLVLGGFNKANQSGTLGLGSDLSGGAFPDDLKPGMTGHYEREGRLDHVKRITAIRRLRHYDLDVLVALTLDDLLEVTHLRIWLICFLGVGATVLIGGLTTLLVREVWRRTRKEIELAADRERLQLAQAQIEVERTRLAETNRELIASKDKAEGANRTKSQFLAHMSHELRTPLHAIIGFSELIRDQAPTGPRHPPLGEYASDILTSGRHLLDLINTILDITKIESGTAILTESMFPLADLVRNALVTIRSQADLRHITIDVRLPEAPIRLFADRTRMLQVLINLLSNAVKFTHEDGQIVVSASMSPSGDVVVSVIDSGIGMTESEILIALEPFGQVDSALSRSYQGTGLGLPLAVRLMELHGGRLEITSIKGKGTAVRITVPAKRVAVRSGTAAA
jgi:two-component system, cell cycle sensor histidine kinase PleC